MDRRADSHIGGAAAEIAAHRRVDVRIGGLRGFAQQPDRRHHLPRLAIAALHHVQLFPGREDRIRNASLHSFNRHHVSPVSVCDGDRTGPAGNAVEMDCAGAAQGLTAAILGPGQIELIPQDPEQRRIGVDVHTPHLAVNGHGQCHDQSLAPDGRLQGHERSGWRFPDRLSRPLAILAMMSRCRAAAAPVRLPEAAALVTGVCHGVWLAPGGVPEAVSFAEAGQRVRAGSPPLVCHARAVARRLGCEPFPALDVLELFAFVRPARFCLPTIPGLAATLLLTPPGNAGDEAAALPAIANALLAELQASPGDDALGVATAMAGGGWPWGPSVLRAIGGAGEDAARDLGTGLRVWTRLKDWHETAPPLPPESWPVEPVEARARLVQLLAADAEPRPQQMDYASAAAAAFAPRERPGEPHVVLAEAGTGVGKTLGYIAPASVWAEKNRGTVWISTFTRNLQRQIDGELDRLFPELGRKRAKVVVRKGRENILCLLNLEDAVTVRGGRGNPGAIGLGLVARWAAATRDGDMIGGDFPGWLADLLGTALTVDLTDTRGECIHAACSHFRKCFIEKQIRRARRAEIVVANHALVLTQAALGSDDAALPTRYVFDEGHHLFDAADSAFSAHLSGRELAELRRWLLGADNRRRARSRGVRERVGDLIADDEKGRKAVDAVVVAARALPGPGWRQRLAESAPMGPAEVFLALVRQQVFARDPTARGGYGLECDLHPPVEGLGAAAARLGEALHRLALPLAGLTEALEALLDGRSDQLDSAGRQRIESLLRGLDRRALRPLAAWRAMLRAVTEATPEPVVDWLGVERVDGREVDVGLHRHWRDPMAPFTAAIAGHAHGALITSATLSDQAGGAPPPGPEDGTGRLPGDAGWQAAEIRTGARHLPAPALCSAVASPFDYAARTRVLVIDDLGREDVERVAAAYRVLFEAAGGGALGLFTAIQRLRAVYERIAGPLEAAGLRLLAQHVDVLDTGTLVDIFRADEEACLLGTDAVRDGVDVPGRSLRLIVFDRVPWPRPTILHRARRDLFGGRSYDEMLVRLRLKQAYGRLIRRAGDRGVFVMLDRGLPSRLLSAFPPGVAVRRLGLAAAAAEIREFLAECAGRGLSGGAGSGP